MDVVAVGDQVCCYVESIFVICVLFRIEEVATDEGGVVVVGVWFSFFVGTVERSVTLPLGGVLFVEIDGSFL